MFSNELICNILDYIDEKILEEIKIDKIAEHFYFNRKYIMKKFKKELNISIVTYSNILKIYNSLKYFKDDKSILEIALKNGFNSQEYFSEIFKNVLGVNPIVYRKYINYIVKLDTKDIEIIQNRLIEIEILLDKINKYKSNRKPQITVKKLSIY